VPSMGPAPVKLGLAAPEGEDVSSPRLADQGWLI
jgi:hypothetical protein